MFESPVVVLVHGLCGFDRLFAGRRPSAEYFPGLARSLRAIGHTVFVPKLSPTSGITTRAAELRQFLTQETGKGPLHLIGHSLGGLDARCAISHFGLADRVRSLTTIGTPHRGSTFADWGVRRLSRLVRPLCRSLGISVDAFFDLTTESCEQFNANTPDAPNVRYRSVAGVCEKPLLNPEWWPSWRMVEAAEGPNDGVVSVHSARWGEQCDVWAGDHLNLVNWPNRKAVRRGEWHDRVDDYVDLINRL